MLKSSVCSVLAAGLIAISVLPAAAESFLSKPAYRSISQSMSPLTDETGIAVLGVDISAGGSTPAAAASFYARLPPHLQVRIDHGCAVMDPNTMLVKQTVVRFCRAFNASRGL